MTHFGGPSWQAKDGSRVVAQRVDGVTVDASAIPWLLLSTVSTTAGPDGDRLAKTTFIQRIATTGGLAPAAADCNAATVGHVVEVPYTADYYFSEGQVALTPHASRPGRARRNASVTRPVALNWTPIRVPTGDCEKVGSSDPRRQRLGAIESASTVAAPGGPTTGPLTVTRAVPTFDSDVPSFPLKVNESCPWKLAFGV